jgi:hypothetical protein
MSTTLSSALRWLSSPELMVVAVVMANCSIMLASPFASSVLDVVVSRMRAFSKSTYVPLFLSWKRIVRRHDPTFRTVASLPWCLLLPTTVMMSPNEKMSESTCGLVFMLLSVVIDGEKRLRLRAFPSPRIGVRACTSMTRRRVVTTQVHDQVFVLGLRCRHGVNCPFQEYWRDHPSRIEEDAVVSTQQHIPNVC